MKEDTHKDYVQDFNYINLQNRQNYSERKPISRAGARSGQKTDSKGA